MGICCCADSKLPPEPVEKEKQGREKKVIANIVKEPDNSDSEPEEKVYALASAVTKPAAPIEYVGEEVELNQESPPLVLGSWKIRGQTQSIRYLLAYLEVEYEEVSYVEREQWTEVKDSLGIDFPNLPYLVRGSLNLTEPIAIM